MPLIVVATVIRRNELIQKKTIFASFSIAKLRAQVIFRSPHARASWSSLSFAIYQFNKTKQKNAINAKAMKCALTMISLFD